MVASKISSSAAAAAVSPQSAKPAATASMVDTAPGSGDLRNRGLGDAGGKCRQGIPRSAANRCRIRRACDQLPSRITSVDGGVAGGATAASPSGNTSAARAPNSRRGGAAPRPPMSCRLLLASAPCTSRPVLLRRLRSEAWRTITTRVSVTRRGSTAHTHSVSTRRQRVQLATCCLSWTRHRRERRGRTRRALPARARRWRRKHRSGSPGSPRQRRVPRDRPPAS